MTPRLRNSLHGALLATLVCLQAPLAFAAYPERTITLIVPFAPGGPTDIIARILSESLSQSLKQSVIVDNRPGAGGNLGMGAAARAKPDGYTLLLASTAIAVNPALFEKLPYDPFKDFAPISELADSPNIVVVRPDSGMNTIADLVARVKAAPGTFNYSSPGAGTKSHLTGEELKQRAAIDMTHIPYRGAGPAALAALEGTVQVASVALPAAEQLVQSGQLRGLAVTGAQRWPSSPTVPTDRIRYPGFISDTSRRCSRHRHTAEYVALLAKIVRPPLPTRKRGRPRSLPASRWLAVRQSNWRRDSRRKFRRQGAAARAGIKINRVVRNRRLLARD